MPFTRLSPAQPGWRFSLLALALMPAASSLAADAADAANPLELPSQAVTAPRETETGYTTQTASTASKSAVPIMQEAQAVQVVTQQVIEDYQVQSLDDAMKFVSGMTQSNTLAGTQDGFVKRGFGTNADGSILRDGIRSSLSRNFSATSERVEVLKGPASLLYGALEPGGLINVISKQPEYRQRTQISGETSSEGGGNLMLDTTGPLGDSGFAYRLIAERQHEDYWRNFGADSHTLIAPSLSWSGEDLRISIAYERREYSTPVDRGTVIINGKPASTEYNARFNERWAKAQGTDELFTAKAEYQLNPDWLSRLTYGWNNERYEMMAAYRRRLTGTDREEQLRCAVAWSTWEGETITLLPNPDYSDHFYDADFALAFARIENHFFVHAGWLEEGQLLRDAEKLKDIPGVIIHGRYDMPCPAKYAWALHKAWPKADFHLIEGAGHAFLEPGILDQLIRATDRFAGKN